VTCVKGGNGWYGLALNELGHRPEDGSVFVFLSKSRKLIKLLHWERDGLVIYHKRLERGCFSPPDSKDDKGEISWPQLVLMVEGISYTSMRKKRRFELKKDG